MHKMQTIFFTKLCKLNDNYVILLLCYVYHSIFRRPASGEHVFRRLPQPEQLPHEFQSNPSICSGHKHRMHRAFNINPQTQRKSNKLVGSPLKYLWVELIFELNLDCLLGLRLECHLRGTMRCHGVRVRVSAPAVNQFDINFRTPSKKVLTWCSSLCLFIFYYYFSQVKAAQWWRIAMYYALTFWHNR